MTDYEPTEEITVKTLVACRDASGVPTLFCASPVTTPEGYNEGEHYEIASGEAEDEGYEDVGLSIDDRDITPDQLIEAFIHLFGDNEIAVQKAIRTLKGQQ